MDVGQLLVAVRGVGVDLDPSADGEQRAQHEAQRDHEEPEREDEIALTHEQLVDAIARSGDRGDGGSAEGVALLVHLHRLDVGGIEVLLPVGVVQPRVPLRSREPAAVGRAAEHLGERLQVERDLATGEEEIALRLLPDEVDLRAGRRRAVLVRCAGARDGDRRLVVDDRDVIEEAPDAREADDGGDHPAEDRHRDARARREESHHDVDVDVLALPGRDRCTEQREPERQALRDVAGAAEEDQERCILQPCEEVAEVHDAEVAELRSEDEADEDGAGGDRLVARRCASA